MEFPFIAHALPARFNEYVAALTSDWVLRRNFKFVASRPAWLTRTHEEFAPTAPIGLRGPVLTAELQRLNVGASSLRFNMTLLHHARATLTDSHFLIPLAAFCIGLALLIFLH